MSVVNSAKKKIMVGDIDLTSDTIKVMLLSSSHTTNIDTQEYIDDVSGNEISGTGYTAGGATLSSKSVTQDNSGDLAKWDAANVAWSSATFTARYAAIYKSTGTPSTSPIIAIIDFGSNKTVSSNTFTIEWDSDGILTLS